MQKLTSRDLNLVVFNYDHLVDGKSSEHDSMMPIKPQTVELKPVMTKMHTTYMLVQISSR